MINRTLKMFIKNKKSVNFTRCIAPAVQHNIGVQISE